MDQVPVNHARFTESFKVLKFLKGDGTKLKVLMFKKNANGTITKSLILTKVKKGIWEDQIKKPHEFDPAA